MGKESKPYNETLEKAPPYFPFFWNDWDTDPHTNNMSLQEDAIFNRFLRKQWVRDTLPAAVTALRRQLGNDLGQVRYEAIKGFFHKWGFLFRCAACEGVAWSESWGQKQPEITAEGGTDIKILYPEYRTGNVIAPYQLCNGCVMVVYCGCTGGVLDVYNSKLKFLKIDDQSTPPLRNRP